MASGHHCPPYWPVPETFAAYGITEASNYSGIRNMEADAMHTHAVLTKLIDASPVLADQSTVEEYLRSFAKTTAEALGLQFCSITLLPEEPSSEEKLCLHSEFRPPASASRNQLLSTAGLLTRQVAATRRTQSAECHISAPYADAHRREQPLRVNLVSLPIILSGTLLGALTLGMQPDSHRADAEQQQLLRILTHLLAISIQVIQLSNILNSEFLRLSLLQAAQQNNAHDCRLAQRATASLTKIVSRTFFHELVKANLGPKEIISVATELLNLLDQRLRGLTTSPHSAHGDLPRAPGICNLPFTSNSGEAS